MPKLESSGVPEMETSKLAAERLRVVSGGAEEKARKWRRRMKCVDFWVKPNW